MRNNEQMDWQGPLTPAVFHILLALAAGEKHGYAIMQDVEAQTAGAIHMGPGTLYGTLKRLLAAGLVAEADDQLTPEPANERRRYYRLTDAGRTAAQIEAKRLESAVEIARRERLISSFEVCP